MKGRKPKPSADKKHVWPRAPAEKLVLPISSNVQPPSWLSTGSREVWQSLASKLNQLGLLDQLDVHTLATYCEAAALYREMSAYLAKNGMTYTTISKHGELNRLRPEYKIMNDAAKTMRSLLAEFGFSPSSRTRLAQSTSTGQGQLPLNDPHHAPHPASAANGIIDPLSHVLAKYH